MQPPKAGAPRTPSTSAESTSPPPAPPTLTGLRAGRYRRVAGRLVLAVVTFCGLGALNGSAAPLTTASVTQLGERLGNPDDVRALIISDSTWLSMRQHGAFDAVRGFRNEMALARCRRRVQPSCTTPVGPPPTLIDELNARGTVVGRNTLIVQTGYNDDEANFESDFRLVVSTARKLHYTRIIWLTLRPPNNDPVKALSYQNANATLAKLVGGGGFSDVAIADWATYSAGQDSWVGTDQIHYTKLGAWAAADYIGRKVAFLNNLACPYPMQKGAKIPTRCPDPDTMTTKPDYAGIYPLTKPYFDPAYIWTGSSSWPNAPWWG